MGAAVAIIAITSAISVAATVYGIVTAPEAPEPIKPPPVPEAPVDPNAGVVETGFEEITEQGQNIRDVQRRRKAATSSKSPVKLEQKSVRRKSLLGE